MASVPDFDEKFLASLFLGNTDKTLLIRYEMHFSISSTSQEVRLFLILIPIIIIPNSRKEMMQFVLNFYDKMGRILEVAYNENNGICVIFITHNGNWSLVRTAQMRYFVHFLSGFRICVTSTHKV